ncbi:MAG: hypothetical protein HW416_2643 [Chloroflexi bacterium]|nr:hypothetical protein [Chloroflexota bacterium]
MIATSNGAAPLYTEEDWHDLVHSGPGTLAGRYLRGFWHPISLASELPIGRAKPIRIMSEEFTLYRGESGAPHLLDFRCAHRRTQLSTGWVEGDDLRCFFHGWKYSPSGQCVEQPVEPEPFCEKVRIKAYPAEEYLGFVFAYLGEGDPPPLPRYPSLETEDEFTIREWRSSSSNHHNLFNSLVTDPTHGIFVHRDTYAEAGRMAVKEVRCEETDYGHATHQTLADGHTRVAHFHMPSMTHGRRTGSDLGRVDGRSGWHEMFTWHVPVDDGHYRGFTISVIHVEGEARARYMADRPKRRARPSDVPPAEELVASVLRGDLHIEDVNAMYREGKIDAHFLTSIQDDVARLGMGVVPDLHAERLGRFDAAEALTRQLWMRELRALALGLPLKQWRHDTRLSVAPVG